MDESLKIKVSIANRVYPLTIKRSEEEKIRLSVKRINEAVKKFEEKYAVKDKQDILAMCSLQFASLYQGQLLSKSAHSTELEDQLKEMHAVLDQVFTK